MLVFGKKKQIMSLIVMGLIIIFPALSLVISIIIGEYYVLALFMLLLSIIISVIFYVKPLIEINNGILTENIPFTFLTKKYKLAKISNIKLKKNLLGKNYLEFIYEGRNKKVSINLVTMTSEDCLRLKNELVKTAW